MGAYTQTAEFFMNPEKSAPLRVPQTRRLRNPGPPNLEDPLHWIVIHKKSVLVGHRFVRQGPA
jgi:hypothetical protein